MFRIHERGLDLQRDDDVLVRLSDIAQQTGLIGAAAEEAGGESVDERVRRR